jgi:hypothetical protein
MVLGMVANIMAIFMQPSDQFRMLISHTPYREKCRLCPSVSEQICQSKRKRTARAVIIA